MKFCLQLKLLVWKNFTLKKRKPLILFTVILIPLILFIIMVAIRWKQQPQPTAATFNQPYPLPSAGLMTTILDFCNTGDGQSHDPHGFQTAGAESIRQRFEQLNNLGLKYDIVRIQESLDAFLKSPKNFTKIFEDLLLFKDNLRLFFNMPLREFFINRTIVTNLLANKLSMDKEAVNELMTSTLHSLHVVEVVVQVLHKKFNEIVSKVKHISKSDIMRALHKMARILENASFTLVEEGFQHFVCENILLPLNLTSVILKTLLTAVCRLNINDSHDTLSSLFNNLHLMEILKKINHGLHLENVISYITPKHVNDTVQHVKSFFSTFKFLKELMSLSKTFSLGTCNSVTGFSDGYSDSNEQNSTEMINQKLFKAWINMQKIICGRNVTIDYETFNNKRKSHDGKLYKF